MNVFWFFVVSFALVILGVGVISTTVYQELVEEKTDYHMGSVMRRYEWRTDNPFVAALGGVILMVGIMLLAWSFIKVTLLD